jgi:Asp-tRNA(Asn)/Glu-tRNA(Gln) amidotransferase A subunit family amidase
MRPKYNHLNLIAFSVDSDDREGGSAEEIMRALWRRVRELEQTGEILEAVGVPDETIENETVWKSRCSSWRWRLSEGRSKGPTPRRPQRPRTSRRVVDGRAAR